MSEYAREFACYMQEISKSTTDKTLQTHYRKDVTVKASDMLSVGARISRCLKDLGVT